MLGARSHPPWRGVALLVAGAFFMEILDGTIIGTAAPRMASSLGVRPVDLNVVITAYLLTLSVFIPVSGWLADRFGARIVFGAAIAVFTVASGLCAISTGLGELTAFRVLQGIGGAMMVPVGRLVVLRKLTPGELINAFAYLTWPALAAPVIAPALGGVLTTYASWRWIFVINLPLGAAALVITARIVPNLPHVDHAPLDWLGFALTGAGLASLVTSLELVSARRVNWPYVATSGAIAIVTLVLAVRHLRRAAHPLVELAALRIPTFRVPNIGGSFFRLAIGAVPFLLPLMFQDAFGWSPLKSGLLVVAVFVGNIGIKPFTGPLLRRFGFRTLLVQAAVWSAVSIALCGLVTSHTPVPLIAFILFVSGVFRSIGFTAYNAIGFVDVPPEAIGDANTLTTTIQQLTGGLAVVAAALALRAGGPLARLFHVSVDARTDFAVAFYLMAVVGLLAMIESAMLPHDAGAAATAATMVEQPT
ncbi:MAG TPA: MFS transporter [Acidothermaceae bacterium]|jgi:EmrB/QacA subfamily drug resistance transporter